MKTTHLFFLILLVACGQKSTEQTSPTASNVQSSQHSNSKSIISSVHASLPSDEQIKQSDLNQLLKNGDISQAEYDQLVAYLK